MIEAEAIMLAPRKVLGLFREKAEAITVKPLTHAGLAETKKFLAATH